MCVYASLSGGESHNIIIFGSLWPRPDLVSRIIV